MVLKGLMLLLKNLFNLTRKFFHGCGQLKIKGANSAKVMSCQIYRNLVIHIKPFRVVINLLGSNGDFGHEGKSIYKGVKLEGFVELTIFDLPTGQLGKFYLNLRIGKFSSFAHYFKNVV